MVMSKHLCMGTGEIASVKQLYFLMCYLLFAIRHKQIIYYLFFLSECASGDQETWESKTGFRQKWSVEFS